MSFLFTGRFAGNGVAQVGGTIYANTFVACFASSNGFLVLMCEASYVDSLLQKINGLNIQDKAGLYKGNLFYGESE
jgi:hypothetical protein